MLNGPLVKQSSGHRLLCALRRSEPQSAESWCSLQQSASSRTVWRRCAQTASQYGIHARLARRPVRSNRVDTNRQFYLLLKQAPELAIRIQLELQIDHDKSIIVISSNKYRTRTVRNYVLWLFLKEEEEEEEEFLTSFAELPPNCQARCATGNGR